MADTTYAPMTCAKPSPKRRSRSFSSDASQIAWNNRPKLRTSAPRIMTEKLQAAWIFTIGSKNTIHG